jgi:hypothetical protein
VLKDLAKLRTPSFRYDGFYGALAVSITSALKPIPKPPWLDIMIYGLDDAVKLIAQYLCKMM